MSGDAIREVDERAAHRLVSRGLDALGLPADQLEKLAKNDKRKQAMAWLVRSRTSVANEWVAEKLHMGHVANVSRAMKWMREGEDKEARRLRRKAEVVAICKD